MLMLLSGTEIDVISRFARVRSLFDHQRLNFTAEKQTQLVAIDTKTRPRRYVFLGPAPAGRHVQ